MARNNPPTPQPSAAGHSLAAEASANGQLALAHVFEPLNAYPGEPLALHTRLVPGSSAGKPALHSMGAMLRITLPPGMEVVAARQLEGPELPPSLLEVSQGRLPVTELVWRLPPGQPAAVCMFHTALRLQPANDNPLLTGLLRGVPSAAQAFSVARLLDNDGNPLAEESTSLILHPKGRYLRYLPEMYAEDDFMGRFLMLFESFWAPIERQVAGIENYFDPQLAPAAFLPWLASWLGLELLDAPDTSLKNEVPHGNEVLEVPLERRRRLIQSAVLLNRSRGTSSSLKTFLEIYTGGKVEIVEHRANDLRLGKMAILGPNVALGTGNRPHTFTVTLRLPSPGPDPETARRRAELRRTVEQIIDEQKPAHTSYTLQIADLPEATKPEPGVRSSVAGENRKTASARSSAPQR